MKGVGANNKIVIPKYNKELMLAVGDNVVEFTPAESGIIPYSCWMGIIKNQITVVDDLDGGTVSSPLPSGGGDV